MTTGQAALLTVLAVPTAGGALCYLLGRRLAGVIRVVAVVTAFVTLLSACRLASGLAEAARTGAASNHFLWVWWADIGGMDISLALRVTALTVFLSVFVALFGFLVVLFSLDYMGKHPHQDKYYAFTLWSIAGALGAIMANNLLFFLISWEVVTVMLFLLVNLGREPAPRGAMKSFIMLGFADCAILLGIVLLILPARHGVGPALVGAGTWNMDLLRVEVGTALSYIVYLLFLVGALAKAGAIPLHTWIPAASEGAPMTVMALLPASVDKLLGIYLLALISLRMFVIDDALRMLLMVIGAVTILGAVMMAMVQHDLRRLLSFHAVSQVGYMVLGIGTGVVVGIAGGLFHMLNNAIYKSCLFLTAGSVERQTGTTELDQLGGLAKTMPVTFVSTLVAALAISGVPPLNGFVSKWLIYQGVLQTRSPLMPLLLVAAVFGSALTLASFVKVIYSVYLGRRPTALKPAQVAEPTWRMWGPTTVLALICVLFGVWAQWPLGQLIAPAVLELTGDVETFAAGWGPISSVVRETGATTGFWSPTLATLLILVGIIIGVGFYLIGRGFKVREVPTFIGGELVTDDRSRLSGTGFYDSIRELPVIETMYRDADSGAYDVYHLGGRYGRRVVELLRRLHSGVLPVYVGWCVVGVVLVVGLLLAYGAG